MTLGMREYCRVEEDASGAQGRRDLVGDGKRVCQDIVDVTLMSQCTRLDSLKKCIYGCLFPTWETQDQVFREGFEKGSGTFRKCQSQSQSHPSFISRVKLCVQLSRNCRADHPVLSLMLDDPCRQGCNIQVYVCAGTGRECPVLRWPQGYPDTIPLCIPKVRRYSFYTQYAWLGFRDVRLA